MDIRHQRVKRLFSLFVNLAIFKYKDLTLSIHYRISIELSDEERQAFADACKDMYTNIQSFSPDIYNTIRSIIEAD